MYSFYNDICLRVFTVVGNDFTSFLISIWGKPGPTTNSYSLSCKHLLGSEYRLNHPSSKTAATILEVTLLIKLHLMDLSALFPWQANAHNFEFVHHIIFDSQDRILQIQWFLHTFVETKNSFLRCHISKLFRHKQEDWRANIIWRWYS